MRKPCCEYEHINKGAWSKQEDEKLINYIRKHGEGCWRSLPKAAGLLRCGKSCRLRWINYLRPNLKRGTKFAEDEEDLIIKLHALLGNRWSLIAARLPGRTDNEVKNYWNSNLRRKLVNMGVDLNKHCRFGHKLIPSQMNGWSSSSGTTEFPGPLGAHRCSCRPLSSHSHADNHDRVSDEASSLEDGARLLPDLNLDPNACPPSSLHGTSGGRKQQLGAQEDMKRGLDDTSPTLLLFR